jgi:flagellar biosynthesis/type III secretory pathway protein FliH
MTTTDPQAYQAAYVKGYQQGYMQGYRQGYRHGLEDGMTGVMRPATTKMRDLIRKWFRGDHPDEPR